jgi:hypothetical protein
MANASRTRPPANLAITLVAMAEWITAATTVPNFAPAADVIINVDLETLVAATTETTTGTAPNRVEDDSAPSTDSTDSTATAANGAATVRTPTTAHAERRPACLNDGPTLSNRVLRSLLDNARLRIATIGADGTTLDIGAARRTPSTGQLHALWRRDHGCAVPGCGRTQFLHAHHVAYWSNGGFTVLDNLILLCSEHHRALHNGVFSIKALGHQRFTFHRADGTTIESAPPLRGTLEGLTDQHPDIGDATIPPDWDGSDLEAYAITAYLLNWKFDVRDERARQQTAGEPAGDERQPPVRAGAGE